MKLLTTLVTTLLALSLWASSNQHAASDKGRDSKASPQHHEAKAKEKPGQDRDRDSHHDHNHGKGKGKDDHHDPRDCDDDRHDHGHGYPKPPKDPVGIPKVPTGLTAAAVSLFQVNVTWTDNSTNESGFKIERSLDGKYFTQIAQVLPNTTTYRDLNRFPDTRYFYRARAFNSKGDSAYSAVARTQTDAPQCELALFDLGSALSPDILSRDPVAVAAGGNLSAVLQRDGAVVSWQLYLGRIDLHVTNVVAIAAGMNHGLALRANGTVVGWGQNPMGQITIPSGLSNVTAIAAGDYHSLALRTDGTVTTWGFNSDHHLAVPTGLTGVVAIAAGNAHSLALRSDGTVVSWGMRLSRPLQNLDWLTNVIAIAAGQNLGSALHADGHVSTWAYGDWGAVPAPTDLTNATSIAVGSTWNVAIRADQTLASWGQPSFFGFPPTNLTAVAAVSLSGLNLLALTEAPVSPTRLTTLILATNRVGLSWLGPLLAPESVLIQRATNVTLTYPIGQPVYEGDWTDLATIPGGATGFEDNSTHTNQTYWYRLIAQNSCGASLSSSVATASIHPPIYQPSLSGQAFAASVILNFNTANNGITGITIERAPDPDGLQSPWQVIASMSATNLLLPYTNAGLALHSTYWYRAKEHNGLGESPYSLPVAISITLPTPPSSLLAQIGTTNKVILSWYASGSDQTGVKIERAMDLDGFPINWIEVGTTTSNAITSYTDTVVEAGRPTYWYRLRSFNSLGDSEYGQPISIKVLSPETPTLSGQNYGTTASLNWHLTYLGTDTYFELERTHGENGTPESWQRIATGTNLPNGGLVYGGYADPDLIAGETYRYRVRLANWLGESPYSSPISITILPPAMPNLDSIYVGGSNYVTLGWWMNNIGLPSEVRIERALDNNFTPGMWTEIGTVTNDTLVWTYPSFFNDSNVSAGAAYWYRLRAADAAGVSDYCPPLRFKVEPPPASSPISGYNFADSARLQWYYPTLPYHAEGFKIQRAPDLNGAPGEWALIGIANPVPAYNSDYYNYFTNYALPAGTYWYRVAPFNWAGDSDYSTPNSVTIQPPYAGSSLTALVGNTQQVTLTWFAPLLNDQDGVEIEHAPDAGGTPGLWSLQARYYRTNQTAIPNVYPIRPYVIVSNVLANTTNWYRLRAFNVVGYSGYLGPAEARTVQPPPAPTDLTAQNQGPHVSLSWSSSFDYGHVSEFELQRAADDAGTPGIWTPFATVTGGDPNYYYYNDSLLAASTQYWYRIRARNWLGQSDFSSPVNVSVPPLPIPNITKLHIGTSNKVELELRVGYYTYGQRGYRIERATDNQGVPGVWSEIGSIFSNFSDSVRFTDTNVSTLTTNWYRARIIGAAGLSDPSPVRRISVTPPPPTYFSATAVAQRVTLSWYPSGYTDYGNVTGFHIERAPDVNAAPGSWTRIGTAAGTVNSVGTYTDTTLPPTNGTYWYRLQAYNWIGSGDYATNRINIQPPQPPHSLTATVSTTNRVKITWYSPYPADQEGFKIERATDVNGQPGNWVELAAFQDTGAYFHGFADTNVSPAATYWYRVRAFTIIGDSLPSNLAKVSLVPPPAASLLASTFANRVNLAWSADYDRYGLIEEFQLERAADTNDSPGVWQKLARLSGDARNYVDTGLSENARHWYRIRARNWLGDSDYSAPVRAVILPPTQPASIAVRIADHTNQVVLRIGAFFPLEQEGFEIDRAREINEVFGPWEFQRRIPATNQWSADYLDTNALAFTTNWYRARAVNAAGTSSNSYALRLALIPPPAPNNFSATAFANQAQLSWSGYFPDYGRVTRFRIERAADILGAPSAWSLLREITNSLPEDPFAWQPGQSASLSILDQNLAAGQTYWYRVQAYNWIGRGDYTYPLSVTIAPPTPPANLTATIGRTNSVELKWTPPQRNDQAGFLVERAYDLNESPGPWTEIATVPNQYPSNPFPGMFYLRYFDTNVTAHSKLWYRVRAFNIVGQSDSSAPTTITLLPPPEPTFNYHSVTANRVTLGFYGPSTYSYGEISGYHLERASDLGNAPGPWNKIASISTTSSQGHYDDTGLLAGKYWYRVRAYNWIGEGSFTSPINVSVIPPNPPISLRARVGYTNQVWLNWTSATPRDQDGFQLELAADVSGSPGAWELLGTISATNTYAADFVRTNVSAFTTNWYRVRAFNSVGFSAYSQPLQFTVAPPVAPEYLNASAYADRADLQWSSYHYSDYGLIEGFLLERSVEVNATPSNWTQIAQVPSDSYNYTYYSDSNLVAEATYSYRVRTFNWVGTSTNSPPAQVTIRKPSAPIYVTTEIGLTNQVTVRWLTGPSQDANIFFIERASDAGNTPGNWTQIGVWTNIYYNPFSDTNITAFTTNWYRIRALNAVGYSDYSTSVVSRIVPPSGINPLQLSRFANQVTFSLVNYLPNYGFLLGHKIERAADNNGTPGNWSQIAVVSIPDYYYYTSSYTDSNLVAATYWYRLSALSWVGNGNYAPPVSVTILPPAPPENIYTSSRPPAEIEIWWYSSYPREQDGFKLERKTGLQSDWTELALISATNSYYVNYIDTNFVPNVTNYYRVRAFNIVGDSGYSTTVSGFISRPAAIPATTSNPLQIESLIVTNHNILITWSGLAGTTNVVEAAAHPTEMFSPISAQLRLVGEGNVTTNFIDVGARTNSATRFYRIREVR